MSCRIRIDVLQAPGAPLNALSRRHIAYVESNHHYPSLVGFRPSQRRKCRYLELMTRNKNKEKRERRREKNRIGLSRASAKAATDHPKKAITRAHNLRSGPGPGCTLGGAEGAPEVTS
ncbi:hypothetical protein TcasGA2_TC016012 [Tribolium castaneum]|uniref:Uncharacterized protein n=1 Tax=Tribolium castaneum TaxID=7070 RepID=D2CG12_TRICA|nr:hypothetical protein TcasGA2_TC016012 [Tribolium castaneum]